MDRPAAVLEGEEPMVKCDRVLQELSNYIDDDVDPSSGRRLRSTCAAATIVRSWWIALARCYTSLETRGFLPFRSAIATGCIPSCHSIWEFDFALLAVAGPKRHFGRRLAQLGMIKVIG